MSSCRDEEKHNGSVVLGIEHKASWKSGSYCPDNVYLVVIQYSQTNVKSLCFEKVLKCLQQHLLNVTAQEHRCLIPSPPVIVLFMLMFCAV